MAKTPHPEKEWTVNVPISELVQLVQAQQQNAQREADIQQLRNEMEGLRGQLRDVLTVLGDLRRQLNGR